MATESSLSDRFSGPKGGEIYLRTVKAKVAFVGAEYVGNDGIQRICGLPLGLFVRHYTGPKNRVDLVVWNVVRPDIPKEYDCDRGVRGMFIFRDPNLPVPDYVANLGRFLPVVLGMDAEQGLVLLANLILQRVVGIVRALPNGGG